MFVVATGSFAQLATGTINASGLGMMIGESTRLDAANDIDNLAADNMAQTIFSDIDDLTVSTVSVNGMEVIGMTLENADLKLTAGGDTLLDDFISIGDGNAIIVSDGLLVQSVGDGDGVDGVIFADGLGLIVSGDTSLENLSNEIGNISGNLQGNAILGNSTDLNVGTVVVDAMETKGVEAESDLVLFVDGDISQTALIVVNGTTLLSVSGDVCLTGAGCDADGANENDFVGRVDAFADSHVEIADSNDLLVGVITVSNQIRLRAGDGESGAIQIEDALTTTDLGGRVLLQADQGIAQSSSSVITTDNLLLGSASNFDARQGDVTLGGNNMVQNIAANIDAELVFTNRRDLEISPLEFSSNCSDFNESLTGIDVVSLVINVTAGDMTSGSLSDASGTATIVQSNADFNVANEIILGDGDAMLEFTDQLIDNLLENNVSEQVVRISASGNRGGPAEADILATSNVSLYVDSSIIFGDVNVDGLLFVDSVEAFPTNGAAGDILQSMKTDNVDSIISASNAAFVSNASVQLTNTSFDRLAVDANQHHSMLTQPFVLNENIGTTFTGSIDANVFADLAAAQFLLNGNPATPLDGILDVEDGFLDDGFFEDNNDFVNPYRVGAIVVNNKTLDLVSFESLALNADQLANVTDSTFAVTTYGDNYFETAEFYDLNLNGNVAVTSVFSNITVVAGNTLSLNDGAELRRIDDGFVVGLVNTKQAGFATDHFVLVDPRSILVVPGDAAFSDLNAQVDSAIGFQAFDLFIGNPGEKSFNIIAGWFVADVSPAEAIDPAFQQSLLQLPGDMTSDFLLADLANFGQGVSAFSLRIESIVDGVQPSLTLTNITQFEQSFFAGQSFLLSQIFVTNDARINLFEDAGSTDLNFTQEVIPTRTVVQNPEVIVVSKPSFNIPETPGAAPQQIFSFVSLVQEPEARPIPTDQQPESYFEIRYTADDDGIFEESFKWTDLNDDPDAIRAALEKAILNNNEEFWPETQDADQGNWTDKIKSKNQIKPGLYYIFEVQEGQTIPEPVDAPVDRTDIENLVEPGSSSEVTQAEDIQFPFDLPANSERVDIVTEQELLTKPVAFDRTEFSAATNSAMLGSMLLLGQCLLNKEKEPSAGSTTNKYQQNNLFSRASRFRRRNQNRMG